MTDTQIEISATDAAGLSENWLFRRCGDLHWRHVYRALGATTVTADGLQDEQGRELYPTFIAVCCRYDVPLREVRVGDRFTTVVEMSHFGRTFFVSRITLANGTSRLTVEMLSAVAAREREGANLLRKAEAPCDPLCGSRALEVPPRLIQLSQLVRRGDHSAFEQRGFRTPAIRGKASPSATCEPSPYFDYNGVGLLYFAAYPTLTDTLERRIARRFALVDDGRDWALSTSTVARDIFYHRNLDLGQKVVARLHRFDRSGDRLLLHTVLSSHDGQVRLADVFTVKQFAVPEPPSARR